MKPALQEHVKVPSVFVQVATQPAVTAAAGEQSQGLLVAAHSSSSVEEDIIWSPFSRGNRVYIFKTKREGAEHEGIITQSQ